MSTLSHLEDSVLAELRAIVRESRSRNGSESRDSLFEALTDLERRAGLVGVSDGILGQVAEIRFFAGILRESVVPIRHLTARRTHRLLAADGELAHEPAIGI